MGKEIEKSATKKVLTWMVVGGAIGAVLSSWLAPKVIAWYFDPPVNIGVNCREATEWAMTRLQTAQFWGTLVGAFLPLILAVFVFRSEAKKSTI